MTTNLPVTRPRWAFRIRRTARCRGVSDVGMTVEVALHTGE